MNNLGGRPVLFNTPEEMQVKIDYYFNSISRDLPAVEQKVDYVDDDGKSHFIEVPVLNNNNEQVMYKQYFEKPTITGLCLSLGMTRQSLLDYEKKPGFFDTIKAAKLKVEHYLEERLDGKDVTGTIFNLKNNFGWVDKNETELSGEIKMPTIHITK